MSIIAEMPKELGNPETAWPYLLNRFPWLFADINTSREPYAQYVRPQASYTETDTKAIAHLKDPTQADVAEILFGDRTKTGGAYRRRILAALDATTTTETTDNPPETDYKAA